MHDMRIDMYGKQGRSSAQLRRRVKKLGLDKVGPTGQVGGNISMDTASENEPSDAESELSVQSRDASAKGQVSSHGDGEVDCSDTATQPQGMVRSAVRSSKKRPKPQKQKLPEKPAVSLDSDDNASLKDSDNESSDDDRWNARRPFRPGYIPQRNTGKRLRKAKEIQPALSSSSLPQSPSERGSGGLENSPSSPALTLGHNTGNSAARKLDNEDEDSSDLGL